ncbi:MAG: hypothetical protein LBF81_03120 [Prevotellaceae bacterium]|jgi:hypothetical protein|nr:hypothetical protein [Prevotellaceae bacterium]
MRTKIIFLFAILASVTTSAAVKVTPLDVNYNTQVVTFKVEWQNATLPHNNRVWVWIDFCSVNGVTPQSFSTATVSNPAKTGGNGTITGGTTRGFFIEYANATNAGTTVTAKLSNAPAGKFNWCAYGSDMPPNATVNAGGGYTLHGTKPFTINGTPGHDSNTFGAGTCITSITDPTGRPDGFAVEPVISNTDSPPRCNAGAVTLSATASGGTTTAMTYTWTIGSANYTTTANSYTTGSLSSSAAYTVKVKNANNCESSPVGGNITINNPGTNGQSATCGCVSGTTNCSGTCKTNSTSSSNGSCSGCNTRTVYYYDVCGNLTSTGSKTDNTCCSGCTGSSQDGSCSGCNTRTVNYYDGCGNLYTTGTRTDAACCSGCSSYQEDGACSGCNTRIVYTKNGCGVVTNTGSRTDSNCTAGCEIDWSECEACLDACMSETSAGFSSCRYDMCAGACEGYTKTR